MPHPLVECVPNFSEARRPEVVEDIQKAIEETPGVTVLDLHSDLDHNRTVITFAGPPEPVGEAAFRAISRAAELIDLNQHSGEHPRIGATDVVPFVPISNVTMEECIEMARRLGRRVGEELGLPVYLYEEAATRPERKNLENIRRGQYEGLKEEILTNPDRAPDFGPKRLGPAGATVIGARSFLIAFNVYLTTDDVEVAKAVARAIRHSSGGLRYVKALGLLVDGRAQVSMNLTDFRKTPVPRVVEMIRREASRYGVGIHHSELVGLIPQEALVDSAVWYLQLDQFKADQILEQRLAARESPGDGMFGAFLDDLAAGTPTPGGGSASAYSAAAAAALVSMVARLTIGKKKYSDVEDRIKSILKRAEELRSSLTEDVQRDAAAFQDLMAAFRLPKETTEGEKARAQRIQAATLEAARVPLEVAKKAVDILELAAEVVEHGNLKAITDGGVASVLAQAAIHGAGLNVRTNISELEDRKSAVAFLASIQAYEDEAAELTQKVRDTLEERGGLSLE